MSMELCYNGLIGMQILKIKQGIWCGTLRWNNYLHLSGVEACMSRFL